MCSLVGSFPKCQEGLGRDRKQQERRREEEGGGGRAGGERTNFGGLTDGLMGIQRNQAAKYS